MIPEDRSVSRRSFLQGAAGAATVAGASGTAAAAEGGDGDGGGEGGDGEGGGSQEVAVVDFAFEPGTEEPLEVAPGTEVTWVWEGDNHNVVVDSKPDESDWEGHETLENSGFEYSHTFEVNGEYSYYCEPHRGQGMVADLVVTDNPTEEEGFESILPDAAKTLGVATTGAMAAVLGLAYFFMKYGGDYGE